MSVDLNHFLSEEESSSESEPESLVLNTTANGSTAIIDNPGGMDIDQIANNNSHDDIDPTANNTNNTINLLANGGGIISVEALFAAELLKEKEKKKKLLLENLNDTNNTHASASSSSSSSLSLDLGNLACYDPSPIDIRKLFYYSKLRQNKQLQKPQTDEKMEMEMGMEMENKIKAVINSTDFNLIAKKHLTQSEYEHRKLDEQYLFAMSRNNVQSMCNKLFALPNVKTAIDDPSIVVQLPRANTKLPREKPVPEKQPMTRWEKFAKRKGIRTTKKTRDLLQFDKNTQTWKKRYGYNRANDMMDEPIIEHRDSEPWASTAGGTGDGAVEDPWTALKKQRNLRRSQNRQNQIRNLKEAYGDRIPGAIDLQSAINFKKRNVLKKNMSRNKHMNNGQPRQSFVAAADMKAKKSSATALKTKYGHLNTSLNIAQQSTASMGKYDVLNKHETKPRLKKNAKITLDYMQSNRNNKLYQLKYGKNAFNHKEREKQSEIMFQIFGKKQTDGFNVQAAAKHAKIQIEDRRYQSKKITARNKSIARARKKTFKKIKSLHHKTKQKGSGK